MYQISWRSKLWLWRYLQNNNDVCLILNFICISNLSIKIPSKCENYLKLVGTYGNYISKCPMMELYASFQRSFHTSPAGWVGGWGSWEYSRSTLVELEVGVELGNILALNIFTQETNKELGINWHIYDDFYLIMG